VEEKNVFRGPKNSKLRGKKQVKTGSLVSLLTVPKL
jgi:hypothetical protein